MGTGALIFGGSFNPLHIGHMRLAIDALERMPEIGQVDFVPVARPAHKNPSGLLPWPLRVRMLNLSLAPYPNMICNTIEGERPGPSYSYDTISQLREVYGAGKLRFLLGSADYALLPTWKRGLELPKLCDLVVAPRDNEDFGDFLSVSARLWGQFRLEKKALNWELTFAGGEKVIYLDIPWLDISASTIRRLWTKGANIDYLAPEPIIKILEEMRPEVMARWQEKESSCSM